MTREDLVGAHSLIRGQGLIAGANFLASIEGIPQRAKTQQEAYAALYAMLQAFLAADQKTEAALLCWGGEMFDPRARAVKLIWKGLAESNKLLIIGGGSQGKTWSTAAEIVLDWAEDPENTATKVISSTAGHAKSNIMAKIFRFHRESAIKLPGKIKATGIELGEDKAASISQVSIPEGDTGKGRLTGFHPMPRNGPAHIKFGNKTRVRAYIDEADTVPAGLWEGLDNMLGSEDANRTVRVVGLTNPRDKSNAFATRAEPIGGWSQIDVDKDDQWLSRDEWLVIRLDPAKSENVLQQTEVFPGMMTYQGFQNYVRKGKGSADYWIMGRGWYPEQTAEFIVVSSQFFDTALGQYLWAGEVTSVISLDPAFAEGGDDPTLTAGKTGTAVGFIPYLGEKVMYRTPLKHALQIEGQFPIKKSDNPEFMGRQVIDICSALNARPESFVQDRTGNALGLYGYLAHKFGTIMGIEWASAATEQKIMEEDAKNAYERYDGISTEMYFAFGHWLQYGWVKFAPMFSGYQEITNEISNRRYFFHRGLQKLEDKTSFKSRNEGRSPDRADSAVMLVHLVRVRNAQNPAMIADKLRKPDRVSFERPGVVDMLEHYDVSS